MNNSNRKLDESEKKIFLKIQEKFIFDLRKNGIPFKIRHTFNSPLLHGVSLETDLNKVGLISNMDYVESVWPLLSKKYNLENMEKMEGAPNLNSVHKLMKVDALHSISGFSGKGVKVAVIDTGVDFTHPSLGGCFGNGCKVFKGFNFVGTDGGVGHSSTQSTPYDDCIGHGTHVSGIIAAKDHNFVGVAPNSTLSVYRIFGCTQKARITSDVVIRALLKAFEDGNEVINMSFGSGSSWAHYLDSRVASSISRYGTIIIAAFGNTGEQGLWGGGAPSVGNDVIAVGSVDSTRYYSKALRIHSQPEGFFEISGSATNSNFDYKMNEGVLGSSYNNEYGCKEFSSDIQGRFVFVKRGVCKFETKAINAERAGALALIVYNNKAGNAGMLIENHNINIPTVMISKKDGENILDRFQKTSSIQVSVTRGNVEIKPRSGGLVSSFSSIGPGALLEGKPDILGPGGKIFSTYPVSKGGYKQISGTSMAAPYISGIAALWLEQKKKDQGDNIRETNYATEFQDVVKSCSKPVVNLELVDGKKIYSSVAKQGTGLVDAQCVLNNRISISPNQIRLGDSVSLGSQKVEIKIKNNYDYPVTYELKHKPAEALSEHDSRGVYMNFLSSGVLSATVELSTSRITLNPKETKIIEARISPPTNEKNGSFWVYSGYLLMNRVDENKSKSPEKLTVSYIGMLGDYSSMRVLPPKESARAPYITTLKKFVQFYKNLDKLGNITEEEMVSTLKDHNYYFKLMNKEIPVLVVKLDHPTMLMTTEVIEAGTNRNMGFMFPKGINTMMGRSLSRGDIPPLGKNKRYHYILPFLGAGIKLVELKPPISKNRKYGRISTESIEHGGINFDEIVKSSSDIFTDMKKLTLTSDELDTVLYSSLASGSPQELMDFHKVSIERVNMSRRIQSILRRLKQLDSMDLADFLTNSAKKLNITSYSFDVTTKPQMLPESDMGKIKAILTKIPSGRYYYRVRALRPMGKVSKKAYTDEWISPEFVLDTSI
ncbi:hypothetical protein BB559_004059 [Furculomyces boomerangus]|uniref:Peptidase S8/S53 domain-containing protein n=1 Tax=Furculomyces boomerangus TaxID=61424 RepID=A0A2T9YGV5_9FUNG|nr:hypothetical protein BB559_004059 [Furculomyces boomerangus]